MGKENPEERSRTGSKNKIGRRSLLKVSGIGLATLSLPTMSVAAESSTEISAESVDPNEPATAETFVKKAIELRYNQQAESAYEALTSVQEQAVIDAYDRLLTTELDVSSSDEVTTQGVPVSRTATLRRKIPTGTVHKTTHTLSFIFRRGRPISSPDNDSTGSAGGLGWKHLGLQDSFLQNQGDVVFSTRIHRYQHPFNLFKEDALIDLEGHNNGSIRVVRKDIVRV